MEGLLAAMDADWLGPWRCLLLPLHPTPAPSLRTAAARIEIKHLSPIPSGMPQESVPMSTCQPLYNAQPTASPVHLPSGAVDQPGCASVVQEILILVISHLGAGLPPSELPLVLGALLSCTSGIPTSCISPVLLVALTFDVQLAAEAVSKLHAVRQADGLQLQRGRNRQGTTKVGCNPGHSRDGLDALANRETVRSSCEPADFGAEDDVGVSGHGGRNTGVAASSRSRAVHVRASSKVVGPGRLAFMTTNSG